MSSLRHKQIKSSADYVRTGFVNALFQLLLCPNDEGSFALANLHLSSSNFLRPIMKTSLLVVAAMAALGSADLILHPAKRSIAARGLSSWGGFALQANPCPSGTSPCQTDSCCPDGYTCNSKSNTPMCCPSSTLLTPTIGGASAIHALWRLTRSPNNRC